MGPAPEGEQSSHTGAEAPGSKTASKTWKPGTDWKQNTTTGWAELLIPVQVTRTIWLRWSRCDDFIRACRRDQIEGRRAPSCGQPDQPPLRLLRSTPAGPTTRSPGERHLDPPFDHDIAPDGGQSRSWLGWASRQRDLIARLRGQEDGGNCNACCTSPNPSQRPTSSPCALPPSTTSCDMWTPGLGWVACLHVCMSACECRAQVASCVRPAARHD